MSTSYSIPRLLSLLFGFSAPVNRRTYLIAGVSLMLLKYEVEWSLAALYYGKSYPLVAFLAPLFSVREHYLKDASGGFLLFLVLWSLPFMWIGVSMTARRAADAGHNPSTGLMLLCPGLNLFCLGIYALLPSASNSAFVKVSSSSHAHNVVEQQANRGDAVSKVGAILVAIVAGAVIVIPVLFFATVAQATYLTVLFLGLPTVMGTVASWIWNRDVERSLLSSSSVAVSAVLFGGAFNLLFAFEGLLCMGMASPFAAAGAGLGAQLGRYLASVTRNRRGVYTNCVALVVALVALAPVEQQFIGEVPVRAITTERIIHAAPAVVWDHVVQFSEIAAPRELLFRSGIAYPIRARIDGEGVGAVRRCEFSTGAFVEPITVWDPPKTLGFSVASQPPTMTETSLYKNLEPRHLRETFVSHKGEFQLVPLDSGRSTLLRGTTWYTLAMAPQSYWTLWTDFFIHQIHGRVLNHIKGAAEANA